MTQHDRLCQIVAEGLKSHKGVVALAADRVHIGTPATATYPCVVITKGKEYPAPNGQLKQFTIRVESRAESEQELHPLLVAVQGAINGYRSGEVHQCILSDTATPDFEGGVHSRRDSFGVFAKAE